MKQYHFPIVIEQDKNGFFVFCPELQGCYSQGDTYEEAVKNIRDAIKLHMEDRKVAREKLPEPALVSLSAVEMTF